MLFRSGIGSSFTLRSSSPMNDEPILALVGGALPSRGVGKKNCSVTAQTRLRKGYESGRVLKGTGEAEKQAFLEIRFCVLACKNAMKLKMSHCLF